MEGKKNDEKKTARAESAVFFYALNGTKINERSEKGAEENSKVLCDQ